MKRIGLALLLTLSWVVARGQTTNCQVIGDNIRCTQVPTLQPVTPPVTPTPALPIYQSPPQPLPPPAPAYMQQQQQQQQLELQREQLQLLQEQHQALEDQQRAGARTLEQPDDTVLKAAYCTGVISAEVKKSRALQSAAATLPPQYVEIAQKEATEMVDRDEAKLERVEAYVNQRAATLQPAPLNGAVRQGQEDWSQISAQTASCDSQCPRPTKDTIKVTTACHARCGEESDAYQHTKICQRLNFLPY